MHVVDLTAFRNKRILITGHTGFKGSWLCRWEPKWNVEKAIEKTVEWVRAYLEDPASVTECMRRQIRAHALLAI